MISYSSLIALVHPDPVIAKAYVGSLVIVRIKHNRLSKFEPKIISSL